MMRAQCRWPLVAQSLVPLIGGALLVGCPLMPYDDPGCRVASCNDGSGCTDDTCDLETGACVFTPIAEGTDCSTDGDVCNGIERCDTQGACRSGDPIDKNDLDPCTSDKCDPLTGAVSHVPIQCEEPGWQLLPVADAPSPRALHSALWTGSEMIVWGGKVSGMPTVTATGARYDPASDSWTPTSMNGAPSPRHSHSAVWTGSEMIVWGGFGASGFETDGARYDPASDSWQPISALGAPQGRTLHATLWTGSEMIVWGGLNQATPLGDGARYHDQNDSWSPMTSAGALGARLKMMAVWTGSQAIFWGGTNTFDWLNDGRYYELGDSWPGAVDASGAPFVREAATALWTGSAMLIWGGWDGGNYLGDGALLDRGGGWTAMSNTDGPADRAEHASVWTGSDLFVWAGCAGMGCNAFLADGGRWQPGPSGGSWTPVLADAIFPGRVEHRAVWTGSEVIVFGGRNDDGLRGDGARATLDRLAPP